MTKRPRDPNQLAKTIIGIATGEIEERQAKAANRAKGGKARAAALTPEQRSEIARAASAARCGIRGGPSFGGRHRHH